MIIDDLVKQRDSWLSPGQDPSGIVISSRVRLARNLRDVSFPGWADTDQRVQVCRTVREAVSHIPALRDAVYIDMDVLDDVDRQVLKERHLISPEMAEKGKGSGLIIAEKGDIAVMINEEDHLRLQAICPGMNLDQVWKRIDSVDSEIEEQLEYAFSAQLGYMTACATNVGTGLRASLMMHLSGLRLIEEIEPVMRGLDKLGVAVRGLLGEGTEAYGNMFQISNYGTLGESEKVLIQRMVKIGTEVAQHERNARARLMEERRAFVLDQIGRAFGILMHARLLGSKEAVDLLSGLRLGVELGLVKNLTVSRINKIMLLTQPGHLQKITGERIDPDDRDERRAGMVRREIKGVSIAAK